MQDEPFFISQLSCAAAVDGTPPSYRGLCKGDTKETAIVRKLSEENRHRAQDDEGGGRRYKEKCGASTHVTTRSKTYT